MVAQRTMVANATTQRRVSGSSRFIITPELLARVLTRQGRTVIPREGDVERPLARPRGFSGMRPTLATHETARGRRLVHIDETLTQIAYSRRGRMKRAQTAMRLRRSCRSFVAGSGSAPRSRRS